MRQTVIVTKIAFTLTIVFLTLNTMEKGILRGFSFSSLIWLTLEVAPDLRIEHTISLLGHLGNTKTLNCIPTHFFWHNLTSDAQNYCTICFKWHLVPRKLKFKRETLCIVEEQFMKISIDTVDELQRSMLQLHSCHQRLHYMVSTSHSITNDKFEKTKYGCVHQRGSPGSF